MLGIKKKQCLSGAAWGIAGHTKCETLEQVKLWKLSIPVL